MDIKFILIKFNKTNKNKKIIGIFKYYKELKEYIKTNKETLLYSSLEVWEAKIIKSKFTI